MNLNNLLEAKPGDVLFFNYKGDNKPASDRFVKVGSLGKDYVHGTDLENNSPRNFSVSKAKNIKRVAKAGQEVKPRDEAISEIFKQTLDLDGTYVAGVLKKISKDIEDVFYFSDADALVITKKPVNTEPELEVSSSDDGYTLSFIKHDGEKLELHYDTKKGLGLTVYDSNLDVIKNVQKPKVSQFVDELKVMFSN